MIRKNNKERRPIILSIITFFIALIWITPFFWMLSTAFKKNSEIFEFPISWIPKDIIMDNFIEVWFGRHPFHIYYLNSIIVTVLTVVGAVFVSSLAAYGFARIKFPGRDLIFLLYLGTMMLPTQVTLIPRFALFNQLGILDTRLALILPGIFNIFCTFLMRQFYIEIPFAISEAAYIDGANEIKTWWHIIMPLTKPAIVTMVILVFTWTWNDYENPLIFLTSEKLFTIPLGLNNFIDEYGTRYAPMMAASISSLIPISALFIFCQNYFIEGVTTTGIKG